MGEAGTPPLCLSLEVCLGVCTRVGYVWEGWEFEALKIFHLPVDLWLLGGALSAAQMSHGWFFGMGEAISQCQFLASVRVYMCRLGSPDPFFPQ